MTEGKGFYVEEKQEGLGSLVREIERREEGASGFALRCCWFRRGKRQAQRKGVRKKRNGVYPYWVCGTGVPLLMGKTSRSWAYAREIWYLKGNYVGGKAGNRPSCENWARGPGWKKKHEK